METKNNKMETQMETLITTNLTNLNQEETTMENTNLNTNITKELTTEQMIELCVTEYKHETNYMAKFGTLHDFAYFGQAHYLIRNRMKPTNVTLEEQEALRELNVELGYEEGEYEDYGIEKGSILYHEEETIRGVDIRFRTQRLREDTELELANINRSEEEQAKLCLNVLKREEAGVSKYNRTNVEEIIIDEILYKIRKEMRRSEITLDKIVLDKIRNLGKVASEDIKHVEKYLHALKLTNKLNNF